MTKKEIRKLKEDSLKKFKNVLKIIEQVNEIVNTPCGYCRVNEIIELTTQTTGCKKCKLFKEKLCGSYTYGCEKKIAYWKAVKNLDNLSYYFEDMELTTYLDIENDKILERENK